MPTKKKKTKPHLNVVVTPTELKRWKTRARAKSGRSLSSWVRDTLNTATLAP